MAVVSCSAFSGSKVISIRFSSGCWGFRKVSEFNFRWSGKKTVAYAWADY